jgi:tRNA dimethylallyltransferase
MPTRLLIIAGPTASGKSGLALDMARRVGGTVINADSMQVYRDLSIISARPSAADIPHLLYGVLDATELGSAAWWAERAREAIAAVEASGRVPILCGGTGLYIRALLQPMAPIPPIPQEARQAARSLHAAIGGAEFYQKLAKYDPEAAARLHVSDSQRLIRAYEVVLGTGKTLGEWQRLAPAVGDEFAARTIVLLPPRDRLYQAIDQRFSWMVSSGALDEVAALVERRLDPALPIMKALGVPELAQYLAGTLDLSEAIVAAQAASRRYAKRQSTWFRHQMPDACFVFEQYSEQNAGLLCHKICEDA